MSLYHQPSPSEPAFLRADGGHANGGEQSEGVQDAARYLFINGDGHCTNHLNLGSFGSPATLQPRPETLRPDVTIGLPFSRSIHLHNSKVAHWFCGLTKNNGVYG
jgi:hypothetical protein